MALSIKGLLWQKEFWVLVFVIATMLLNWPILTIPAGHEVLGIPATLVYVPTVWLLMILITYLFDRWYKG